MRKPPVLLSFAAALALAAGALFATQPPPAAEAPPPSSATQKPFDEANYPLKPHHAALQFACAHCHGDGPAEDYRRLLTRDCLGCHGSAEKVARRTAFMDANHTNPHNSLHDRLDLDCYECHAEHKPSLMLCQVCHDNTADWFGKTP